MKIALCFAGQPRSVEAAYGYYEQFVFKPNVAKHHIDTFIHSWIDPSILGKKPISAGGIPASDPIPENIDKIILSLYQPADYVFSEQLQFDPKNYNERKYPQIKVHYSLSQRYSVMQSINLAIEYATKNNFTYDYIIKSRFDWVMKTPVDFEYLLEHTPLSTHILAPNDCPHPGGLNDHFAIGIQNSMEIYGNLYNHLEEHYNNGIAFCDELLLAAHLQKYNAPYYPLHIPYTIIRGPNAHLRFKEDILDS